MRTEVAALPPERGFRAATLALHNREYRIFWIAALISNTGGWMQNTAIPYVVFQLTGLNSGVGVAGFLTYFPYMVAGAVGGTLADRFDRKHLLVVTQIAQAAFAVGLWILVAGGWATPAWLGALAFGSGLASGLNVPIWQAFVTQLVPRDLLVNAVTLNSTQFNAARALGTFLAGLLLTLWGAGALFALNTLSFGSVLIALAMIRVYRKPEPGPRAPAVADIMAGFRYVRSTPAIRTCCVGIVAIAGIASPLFSFLPASYGQVVFDVEGWRLALLIAAGGIGTLLLAPVILTVGERMPRRQLLVAAMAGYGLATALVGLAPSLYWAVAALALYGGSYLAVASAMNTTIQLVAREDMRGKAVAVYIMCLTGALPVGLVVWGWAADAWGIRTVTVAAGAALLVVTALFLMTGRFDSMAAADAS